MRDILSELRNWVEQGKPVALATVVQTWGSSPRGVGAKMAFTEDGKIAGSVSGGCVEGAVFETGVEVLHSGKPRLLHFGVADETAWGVGLACGGQIDVFVEALDKRYFEVVREELLTEKPHAIATVIQGPEGLAGQKVMMRNENILLDTLSQEVSEDVKGEIQRVQSEGRSQRIKLRTGERERMEVFVEVVEPAPTLVMVGGVHIAVALTQIAKALGFRTVVVDPRRSFGSPERFPHVDQLIQAWPQEAFGQIGLDHLTAVAMLTHDPKIDDPALQLALNSPAFYIGALGSQKTQAKRRKRLLEAGITEEQIERLNGPIGLDIGGDTPEEIALAVMAEVVAVRRGAKAGANASNDK